MHLKIIIAKTWTFITPCSQDGSSDLYKFLENVGQRNEEDAAGLLLKIEAAAKDEMGPRILNINMCHKIDGNIYQISSGSLRMLFFYSETKRKVIVCAVCFLKKGKKTPTKFIDSAKSIEELYNDSEKKGEVTFLTDKEEQK